MLLRRTLLVLVVGGLLVLAGGPAHLWAQQAENGASPATAGRADAERPDELPPDEVAPAGPVRGVVPLPVFGVSPEDGVLLGAAALFFRVPEPGAPTDTISTNAFYGTRGTFSLNVGTDHRMGDRGLNLLTFHRASIFSSDFYGIGMDANDAETFETLELRARGAVLFPVVPRVTVGPSYVVNYYDTRSTEAGGALASGAVRGADGTFAVGVGARSIFDSRDSNVYPTEGAYIDLITHGFPTFLGSSDTFWLGALDTRYFVSPWPWLTLGGQAVLELSAGDVPFQFLPSIGGGDLMRGVLDGRYRDAVSLAAQIEARFPIFWRFGGTIFAGAGRVAPSLDQLALDNLATAAGVGVRFAVNPEQRLNVRFDLAHDGEELKVYVNFQEAF